MPGRVKTWDKFVGITFAAMMLLRIMELFVFRTINTHSLVVYVVGIVVSVLILRTTKIDTTEIGLGPVKPPKAEAFSAVFIITMVPLLVGLAAELLFIKLSGSPSVFIDLGSDIYYHTPEGSLAYGIKNAAMYSLTGIGIVFLQSLFLELFFRGIVLNAFCKQEKPLAVCISIQAALFALWFCVRPLANLFFNEDKEQALIVLLLYIVYEFLLGFRLGMLKVMCSTVWPCVINIFVSNTVMSFVHIEQYTANNYEDFVRKIVIQLLMLGVTFVFYLVFERRETLYFGILHRFEPIELEFDEDIADMDEVEDESDSESNSESDNDKESDSES